MRHHLCRTALAGLALSVAAASGAAAAPSTAGPAAALAAAPERSAASVELASVATGAQDGGHEAPTAPGEPSQVSASSVWGWVKSAARWVKKHIGFSDGTPVVKGTHDIGGGGK